VGYIFCSRFLFIYFLTILVRPIFSKIYRSDLRQIFSVGRTVGMDNQSEISSSIPQGTLPWQPFFGSARVSCGAAGRANVGLCPAAILQQQVGEKEVEIFEKSTNWQSTASWSENASERTWTDNPELSMG